MRPLDEFWSPPTQEPVKRMLAYIVETDAMRLKTTVIGKALKKLGFDVVSGSSLDSAAFDRRITGAENSLIILPASSDPAKDISEIAKYSPQLSTRSFALYITDKISPEQYKTLLRLGWADSTDWNSAVDELRRLAQHLKEAGAPREGKAAYPSASRVISFVGSSGGPGNTTIAMETGVYLASLSGKEAVRVALLDLDFVNSVVCEYLDMQPRLDLGAISGKPERLDGYLLNIMASKHSSGLDIYASSQSWLARGEETERSIYLLLNQLLSQYDFVLLDIPSHRSSELDEILQKSDFIFVTALFSVPSIKQVRRVLQQLIGLEIPLSRVAAVVTDAEVKLFGMVSQRFNVKDILSDVRIFFVRRDRAFALECVDAGTSMTQSQPHRGVSLDIKKIGEHLKGVVPIETMQASSERSMESDNV